MSDLYLPSLHADTIVSKVLNYVMRHQRVHSPDLSAYRQIIKPTRYGWYDMLEPYFTQDSIGFGSKYKPRRWGLLRRTHDAAHPQWSYFHWAGPATPRLYRERMRPREIDAVLQRLEREMLVRELDEWETMWLEALR